MKVTFSVSSQSILKGLSRNLVTIWHYYLVIWQQPWKFREISVCISKVRPFDM